MFGAGQQTNVRKLARGRRIETDSPFIDAPEGEADCAVSGVPNAAIALDATLG